MMKRNRIVGWVVGCAVFGACTAAAQTSGADSTYISDIVEAESVVDSLRMQIRQLDRELQTMKQNYAEAGDVDLLLEALAVPDALDPNAPEDTRSRRQRVDTLLRAITQRPGQLRFNGAATVVMQELLSGETKNGAGAGTFDLYAHTSFGPGTLLFFAFEAGNGEGIDAYLPLTAPLNGDAAPTRSTDGFDLLVLNEAWAEFTALGEAVILTAGKIDLTNYFDINLAANDETSQFLAGAFVNSAALVAPAPGPGLRARTVLLRRFSVQAAVSSADSNGGTRFADAFVIGSVGLRTLPDSRYDGNLRAYTYRPAQYDGALGWGLSLDQTLADAWTVFGRHGSNESALWRDGAARRAWSAGLQWSGRWLGREVTLAGAYGEARESAGNLTTTFETYASLRLNTWTYLAPHWQVVRNESELAQAVNAIGMRVQFNF